MGAAHGIAAFLALASAMAAQPGLPPEVLLLSRIKMHVRSQLARQPNYICVESVTRYHKPPGRRARMKLVDTVRLEVAGNGDRELYSSPGAGAFRDDSPARFIGSGLFGDGLFALHLRTIFVEDRGTFRYRGEDDLAGEPAVRFDFRVPVQASGYTIRIPGSEGDVGMKGSFWADPQSLDLLRMEIHADEIPPNLPVMDAFTLVEYGRVRVGDSDVLLPQHGELRLTEIAGRESRNLIDFTQCRAFSAQSAVSFGVPPGLSALSAQPDHAAESGAADAEEMLPSGLSMTIALTTPVTDRSSVGELLGGKVIGNVLYKHAVVVPDGATVTGRIRRLERYQDAGDYCIVGIEFTEIATPDARLLFFADLRGMDHTPGIGWLVTNSSVYARTLPGGGRAFESATESILPHELPGVGSFFVRGEHFELPAGFRTTWRTTDLR